MKRQVSLVAIKGGIRLTGAHDLQTKVTVTLFGLFAEIECELIVMRTKEVLAAARAAGKQLGHPRGAVGRSRLDTRKEQIRELLALKVSKASIAKMTGVDRST